MAAYIIVKKLSACHSSPSSLIDPCICFLLILMIMSLFLALAGCAHKQETVTVQSPGGSYTGLMADGEPVNLFVSESKNGIMGQGAISGEPVVLSGVEVWSAAGTLLHSDGSTSLVRVYIEPGSDNLVIENLEEIPTVLESGGSSVAIDSGPFSGRYKVEGKHKGFASADIIQTGSLIVGAGTVLDQPVSITGQVTEPGSAVGSITYQDQSQILFKAVLSADGKNITFSGMGEPVTLERY